MSGWQNQHNWTVLLHDDCLVLIPHVILRKRLCTKDIQHVRGSENPSHIPHFSLPSSLPWHSVIIKLNHLTWMQFTHTIMWRIMWRISEGYGRDEGRDESQEMPLNKGLLLKKREGWRKKECSVSLTLKKRSRSHVWPCDLSVWINIILSTKFNTIPSFLIPLYLSEIQTITTPWFWANENRTFLSLNSDYTLTKVPLYPN